ncbi:WXG100 family type VII secretion target [Nocardia takedensis]
MEIEQDTPRTAFAMVPGEVADAGAYVEQVAGSLINGLNSLDREVSSVLENWKGAAADAFAEGWTVAKDGAATVLAALTDMGEMLRVTSETVAGRDVSNATGFGSLDLPESSM